MTDHKNPAAEPRGPLSEAERACFDLMANGGGYMSPSNAACTALDLDTALRAALKERDEARGETVRWRDKAYIALTARVKDDEAVKAERDTLRAQLEIAREGLKEATAPDSEFENTKFKLCGCEESAAWQGLVKRRKFIAYEALAKLEEKSK